VTLTPWNEEFRARCQSLLALQCWLWGHDVRRPEGNLLVAHGFERVPAPAGVPAHSRYQLRLSSRSTITLWSFGFYYSRCGRGGIFLEREDGLPRFGHHAGFVERVWTREALQLACPTECYADHQPDVGYLLIKATDWISRYERWVLERLGVEYRRRILDDWHGPSIEPQRLSQEWQSIGRYGREGGRAPEQLCSQ
jgi:hypothetical protein